MVALISKVVNFCSFKAKIVDLTWKIEYIIVSIGVPA